MLQFTAHEVETVSVQLFQKIINTSPININSPTEIEYNDLEHLPGKSTNYIF